MIEQFAPSNGYNQLGSSLAAQLYSAQNWNPYAQEARIKSEIEIKHKEKRKQKLLLVAEENEV